MHRSALTLVFCITIALAASTSARAQSLLERLEKRLEGVIDGPIPEVPAPAAPLATAPAVLPGYLGIVADDIEGTSGALIIEVKPGSPAETAGLKVGDVVTQIDGRAVAGVDEFGSRMSSKLSGEKVTFTVSRSGKDESLTATLTDRPPLAETASPASPPSGTHSDSLPSPRTASPRSSSAPPSLGVTVLPVTDDARARYSLAVRQGALITEVRPGSAADKAGFAPGNVIVAVEGKRVEKPDDLIGVIRTMRPGDEIMLSYYRGGTLYRKTLALGEAAGSPSVARSAPSPPSVPEDRPVLRKIERAIDGLIPPATEPRRPLVERPISDDPVVLRREVEDLRSKVDELEKRLAEMEATFKPAPVPRRPAVPESALPGPADEPPKLELKKPE